MKHDYKQFKMWQKAGANNLAVYNLTKSFPNDEMYGLTNQLRQCISSVLSNIAKGSRYDSYAQFAKFLYIALGSVCKAKCQPILAFDLNYINEKDLNKILIDLEEQKKTIYGIIKSLKKENNLNIPIWIGLVFTSLSFILNN